MEKNIVKAIETAASTNNEEEKEVIAPVKFVDKEERFQDRYRENQ